MKSHHRIRDGATASLLQSGHSKRLSLPRVGIWPRSSPELPVTSQCSRVDRVCNLLEPMCASRRPTSKTAAWHNGVAWRSRQSNVAVTSGRAASAAQNQVKDWPKKRQEQHDNDPDKLHAHLGRTGENEVDDIDIENEQKQTND